MCFQDLESVRGTGVAAPGAAGDSQGETKEEGGGGITGVVRDEAGLPRVELILPRAGEEEREGLARLIGAMDACAGASGFAPTRAAFCARSGVTDTVYLKYFASYSAMVRACGYGTAAEQRSALRAQKRASLRVGGRGETGVKSGRGRVFGEPMEGCDMSSAPVNEQGVVMLFGMLAGKLGFRVEMVQTAFPDCEARRKCADGKWREVRIEFEYVSSRFDHDPKGCDLVVCWEKDREIPGVEVMALKEEMERMEKEAQRLHSARA